MAPERLILGGLFALAAIVALVRGFREEWGSGGSDREAISHVPGWWPLGEVAWRGWVRCGAAAMLAAPFLGASFAFSNTGGTGLVAAIETALLVAAGAGLALIWCVFLFNAPSRAIAPPFRGLPGAVHEWLWSSPDSSRVQQRRRPKRDGDDGLAAAAIRAIPALEGALDPSDPEERVAQLLVTRIDSEFARLPPGNERMEPYWSFFDRMASEEFDVWYADLFTLDFAFYLSQTPIEARHRVLAALRAETPSFERMIVAELHELEKRVHKLK